VIPVLLCGLFAEAPKVEEEPPAKLLDDLFRKTKATPCIYWLPLTEEQVSRIFTNVFNNYEVVVVMCYVFSVSLL
jgi:hypothetical protein